MTPVEMEFLENKYRKCADILMEIRIKDEVLTETDVDNAILYGKILKQRNDRWDEFKKLATLLGSAFAPVVSRVDMVTIAEEYNK